MTAQRLINLALRDLKVILSGQAPSTDQSTDGFDTLNEILASWSHEGLLLPTHVVSVFSLTSAQRNYTFGVAANWATTALPVKVTGALAELTVTGGAFQHGLQILPMGEFESSIANEIGRAAVLPLKLGIDNSAPLRNIRLWPTPNNSSATIEIAYWIPLTAFATLGDAVAFALPAFEVAVRNELTLRLAAMYEIPLTPDMTSNAQSSRAALARTDPAEIALPLAPVPGPSNSSKMSQ